MRTLPFSTAYPSYHPRKGQQTDFVPKIWQSLYDCGLVTMSKIAELVRETRLPYPDTVDQVRDYLYKTVTPKGHTIRAGKRWKAGDWFKPVIWGTDINPKSGRSGPYQSKQIQFAPPIQIVKVWDYKVKCFEKSEIWYLNGTAVSENSEYMQQWFNAGLIEAIAANDGLTLADFLAWFRHPKPFDGQILCWSDKIRY